MRERRRAVRLTDVGRETLRKFGLPDLVALAMARGWRLVWDPAYAAEDARFRASAAPWLVRVPCRAGFVGVHGRDALSGCCQRRGVMPRLLELAGVMVVQRGDREVLVTFGVEDLDDVAAVLGVRRRRRLSPEHLERLRRQIAAARESDKTGTSGAQVARSHPRGAV